MTKRIFSILFVFSIFVVTITSCNKDNGTPSGTYQFTADLDGTSKVFSVLSSAAETTPSGLFSLTLIGVGATESISLILWSDKDDFVAGKTFTIQGPSGKENTM